jgi:hypothetical protein
MSLKKFDRPLFIDESAKRVWEEPCTKRIVHQILSSLKPPDQLCREVLSPEKVGHDRHSDFFEGTAQIDDKINCNRKSGGNLRIVSTFWDTSRSMNIDIA